MNQQNADYLKETIKYLGFGETLYADLDKNMEQKFPEFVLKLESVFNKAVLESILFFRRSDQGVYFFNRHDEVLKNEVGTTEQTFYVNKGHSVTLKEAFNLLEGRSVLKEIVSKEGEKYQAWIQLDFSEREPNGNYKIRQYHSNYGFDLAATLAGFAIREMEDEQQRERIMRSLQRGNLQPLTFFRSGTDQRFLVHAHPRYKTISILEHPSATPLNNAQKSLLMKDHDTTERQRINNREVVTGDEAKGQLIADELKPGKEVENGGKASGEDEGILPREELPYGQEMATS